MEITSIHKKKHTDPVYSKSEYIHDIIGQAIRNKYLPPGSTLPSVVKAAGEFGAARKRVVRAFGKFRKIDFMESRPPTGYFVLSASTDQKIRALHLIHSFDPHFETLVNEFQDETVPEHHYSDIIDHKEFFKNEFSMIKKVR